MKNYWNDSVTNCTGVIHTFALYNYQKVALIAGAAIASYCYQHAKDGIYIQDNGDTSAQKAAYKMCWNYL